MKEYIEAFESILKGHFPIQGGWLEKRLASLTFSGFLLYSVDPHVLVPLIAAALPKDTRISLVSPVVRPAPPVDGIYRDMYCVQMYSSEFPKIKEEGAIPNMELVLHGKPDGQITAVVSIPATGSSLSISDVAREIGSASRAVVGYRDIQEDDSSVAIRNDKIRIHLSDEKAIPIQLLRLSDLKDGDVILVKSIEDMRAIFDAFQMSKEGSQDVTVTLTREGIEKLSLTEAIDTLESIIGVPGYHTKLANLINMVLSPDVMSSDVIRMAEDIRNQYLNHHLPGISDQLRSHE